MENASKALIMAGSVLLALLIISTLVFMFGKLGDLKNSEASAEEVKKLAEYNRQIETFDRALYGSELLSLANLIDDYNKRQSDLKGYNAIILQVYSKGIAGAIYMKDNYTRDDSYKDLISDFENLQKKLNQAKNKKAYGEKIEKLAGMKWEALRQLLMSTGLTIEEADNILNDSNSDLNKLISEYQNLKSESTEFKNKQFTQHEYEYDDYYNGTRVKKIIFKEHGL